MPEKAQPGPKPSPRARSRKTLMIGLSGVTVLLGFLIVIRPRLVANPELLRQQATKAAQQGRWDEAEAALGRLTDPTPADWLLKAVVATSLKQPEAALGYLAKIPPNGPLAARVALVTSRVELSRFRARPTEDALLTALRIDPKLAEARRSFVYLYGVQGRRFELLEQFTALAGQGPLTFDLVRNWCIAHFDEIKEPDELKSTLEQFVENDPDDRWSRLALARVYRRLGLLDRARECLATIAESDAEARACRAEIEFERGDLEAIKVLLEGGPRDHPKLERLRGQLALKCQDSPSAVRHFRLSDESEPNNGETLYGLAQALKIVGDRAAAEPYARRAEAYQNLRVHLIRDDNRQESQVDFCCRLGSDCEAANFLPEARAWYRLALLADPLQQQAQQALFRLSKSD